MNNSNENIFPKSEAFIATVARLFANEGDLLAVEVLSTAKPRFEFYTHDNWNEGFDVFDLYLEMSLSAYSKLGDKRQLLENGILEKLQSVTQGHTSDHIQSVTIVLEITEGDNWRGKAQKWTSCESGPIQAPDKKLDKGIIPINPEVFNIPPNGIIENQVAVMMPFAKEYDGAYISIKNACSAVGLKAVRADDIWSNSTFIQDIFEIIYCSKIIVVDFSTRNPNVMYETGIAHTLGRHVIPITRSIDDVPSDLQHHRALQYHPNTEGLTLLKNGLTVRLSTVTGREAKLNG